VIKLPRLRLASPAISFPSRFSVRPPSRGSAVLIAAVLLLCGIAPAGSAAKAPAAPAPDPVRYGLIWLDVEPAPAEVALDGEYLDQGVWLLSVAPGEHEVRVRKAGFRSHAERIVVPPGGSVHIEVRLLPGDGTHL
jgi:hypothetical protein